MNWIYKRTGSASSFINKLIAETSKVPNESWFRFIYHLLVRQSWKRLFQRLSTHIRNNHDSQFLFLRNRPTSLHNTWVWYKSDDHSSAAVGTMPKGQDRCELAAVTCSALVILAVHAFIYLFIWNSLMTHLEPKIIEEFSGFNFSSNPNDTLSAHGTVLFPEDY